MAGERLIKWMDSQGGSDSDYADIVYGTVLSTSPLKIQMSNQLILDDSFLDLDDAVTDYKVKMKIDGDEKDVTVMNKLKDGDGVTMIRFHGGQRFYVLAKNEGGD